MKWPSNWQLKTSVTQKKTTPLPSPTGGRKYRPEVECNQFRVYRNIFAEKSALLRHNATRQKSHHFSRRIFHTPKNLSLLFPIVFQTQLAHPFLNRSHPDLGPRRFHRIVQD